MNKQLEAFLHNLPNLHIGVVGDLMLDRYLFGAVKRISPEAPVPVNCVEKVEDRLGGAANVAANLRGLLAKVHLFGVIGADAEGEALRKLLFTQGVDTEAIAAQPERRTTTKVRIIGARQQMVRIDFEDKRDISDDAVESLCKALAKDLERGLQALILSDYGKGVCTDYLCQKVIALAKEYAVPIIVDPKREDWTCYTGADWITPNVNELGMAGEGKVANDDSIIPVAAGLCRKYNLGKVAVTRSEKGITVVNANGMVCHEAATAREVFDVSGAGDTAVAVLAAAIAGNLPIRESLQVANKAAGVVVGKVGTYAIQKEELTDALTVFAKGPQLYSRDEVRMLAEKWRQTGQKIVFTNGCFDILHRGHIEYLRAAARMGDKLIIGVNSDASVKRLKGESRPINGQEDRALLLSELRFVDAVVIFDEDTPLQLVAAIRPDILVKGGDYRVEQVVGREYAGRVEIVPFWEGYSTTGVIDRISKRAEK